MGANNTNRISGLNTTRDRAKIRYLTYTIDVIEYPQKHSPTKTPQPEHLAIMNVLRVLAIGLVVIFLFQMCQQGKIGSLFGMIVAGVSFIMALIISINCEPAWMKRWIDNEEVELRKFPILYTIRFIGIMIFLIALMASADLILVRRGHAIILAIFSIVMIIFLIAMPPSKVIGRKSP